MNPIVIINGRSFMLMRTALIPQLHESIGGQWVKVPCTDRAFYRAYTEARKVTP